MSDAIKVTVSDPDTGEVLAERVIDNDYVILCAGNRCDEYPCGSCGLLFFFAGPVPDASWRCRACRPIPPEVSDEIGAHQYEMDRGDAA